MHCTVRTHQHAFLAAAAHPVRRRPCIALPRLHLKSILSTLLAWNMGAPVASTSLASGLCEFGALRRTQKRSPISRLWGSVTADQQQFALLCSTRPRRSMKAERTDRREHTYTGETAHEKATPARRGELRQAARADVSVRASSAAASGSVRVEDDVHGCPANSEYCHEPTKKIPRTGQDSNSTTSCTARRQSRIIITSRRLLRRDLVPRSLAAGLLRQVRTPPCRAHCMQSRCS